MRALLRADWLRLRRRKDLWIIAIAVCVVGLVSFLAAYRSDAADPTWLTMNAAQIRDEVLGYSDFEGFSQAEIDQQIELLVAERIAQNEQELASFEEQQQISLQRYAFPQSIFTVVGSGTITLLALVLIASLSVGDEFRFGTIRTSLLASSHRRRFLAARLASLVAIAVALYAALILLGTVLGVGLVAIGADVGANTIRVDPASAAAWLGAQLLTTVVVIALATALSILLRSGALPLLLILVGGLVDLAVAHLPVFAPNELLSGVPQAFLGQSIRTLTASTGLATHALALSAAGDTPYQAIEIPLIGVAAVIAAWGVLFILIADRRLRTMDVVE